MSEDGGEDDGEGGGDERDYEDEDATDVELSTLMGCTILVGLTYLDSEGAFESQEQIHGTVTSVDDNSVYVMLGGKRAGETWTMPADASAVKKAKPGVYSLRSTDETVVDPDFLSRWTIKRPPVKH